MFPHVFLLSRDQVWKSSIYDLLDLLSDYTWWHLINRFVYALTIQCPLPGGWYKMSSTCRQPSVTTASLYTLPLTFCPLFMNYSFKMSSFCAKLCFGCVLGFHVLHKPTSMHLFSPRMFIGKRRTSGCSWNIEVHRQLGLYNVSSTFLNARLFLSEGCKNPDLDTWFSGPAGFVHVCR